MQLNKSELLEAYRKMSLIRQFEELVATAYSQGKIPGFVHLYAGEEAVATGVCMALEKNDYISSTHRGHGHCIAKDCEVKKMLAELFGKETGSCKGKGGSMHIFEKDKYMLGACGIVGGGIAMATGAALSCKLRKTGQVVACFLGDGATNQGVFHESVNLASIWQLPIVYVIENNLYAESTPVEYSIKVKNIAERGKAYGIPGVTADGLDFFSVNKETKEAIERARKGHGPTLLECKTYRYVGHYQGDTITYRTQDEVNYYRAKDCIEAFASKVLSEGLISQEELDGVKEAVKMDIKAALRFAQESPQPKGEECLEDVYVNY